MTKMSEVRSQRMATVAVVMTWVVKKDPSRFD